MLEGFAIAGAVAPGTTIKSGTVVLDFEDALIDDIRLCIHASHDTGFQSLATIFDVTDNVQLLSLNVPAVAGLAQTDWTRVATSAGQHTLELRIIGDGADVTTIFNAHLQARTLSADSA